MWNLKQEDLIKQAPIGVFSLVMILTGSLVNQYPTNEKIVNDIDCNKAANNNNNNNNTIVGDGIFPPYVSSVLVFLLPIIPLLVPPIEERKWEMITSHIVGQTGSFGSSEVARHFIISPEAHFYEKCNLTLDECVNLNNNNSLYDVCNKSNLPQSTLFNSLHGSPNVLLVMVGASLFAFFISVKHWKSQQVGKVDNCTKYVLKICFMVLCLFIITFIVINCYLQHNFSPSQVMASIIYGVFLQAIVSGFFKHKKINTFEAIPTHIPLDSVEGKYKDKF